MTEILQKLIDLVQQSAPALWEIARRQVVALSIQDGVVLLVFLILGSIGFHYIMPVWKWGFTGEKDSWGLRKDDHTVEAGFLIGTLVLVDIVSVVVIISNAVAIAMRLANPDFYAILILLNLVR